MIKIFEFSPEEEVLIYTLTGLLYIHKKNWLNIDDIVTIFDPPEFVDRNKLSFEIEDLLIRMNKCEFVFCDGVGNYQFNTNAIFNSFTNYSDKAIH